MPPRRAPVCRILVPAAALAAAPALCLGASYRDLVEGAAAALARGDPKTCLELSEQALRLDPGGAEALLVLGRTYVTLDRGEEAVTALRRAADLASPTSPVGVEARFALSDALVAGGEHNEEAIRVLTDLLAASPGRPGVHLELGRIHLALGRLSPSRTEFEREIALRHDGPGSGSLVAAAYEGLGTAAYRMGDDEAAIAALSRTRPSVESRYHLGLALARRGRPQEAAAALREALRADPDHRGALQALARCAGALGLEDERRSSLERFEASYRREQQRGALKVQVGDLRARAEARRSARDAAGAAAALEEAARLSPDDLDLRVDLARALYRAGDAARAEASFRSVLAARPLDTAAHHGLGRILADRADLSGALESLKAAARLSPLTLSYRTALGQIHLRMGRPVEALEELRFARRLDPSSAEAAFNLGLGLAQAGALPEAAQEIEAAIALGYEQPQAHQILAQVYERLGDAERSAREREILRRGSGETPRPAPRR